MSQPNKDDQTSLATETLLANVVNAIDGLLLVLDQDLRVVLSNCSDQEDRQKAVDSGTIHCYELVMNRSQPCQPCLAREVFASGEPEHREQSSMSVGHIQDIHAYPIKDDLGRVVMVVEHIQDITSKKLAQETLERASNINATMARMCEELLGTLTRGDVFSTVLTTAKQITDSEHGFLGLMEQSESGRTKYMVASPEVLGNPPDETDFWLSDDSTGPGNWVSKYRRPLMSNDPLHDPRLKGRMPGDLCLRNFLSVPLMVKGRLLGQLAVANTRRKYGEQEQAVLQRMSFILAMVLQHLMDDEELAAHQERLRALAVQLTSSEEKERRLIASDLHDSVGQHLSMASQRLKMLCLEQEPRPDFLEQAIELVDLAISETRSLTIQLSPPVLFTLGLEAALEWLAENSQQNMGLEIDLQNDGQDKPLGVEISAFVFRAVLELLRNVVKHAGVNQAVVSLARRDEELLVEVKDQGRGFDYAATRMLPGTGFGLFSIEQRMITLGGCFQLESHPNQGTRAFMQVPLEQQDKESV